MLQISTGKLFARPVGRENLLRGMLYTNAILAREEAVETVAGRLSASSSYSIRPTVLVYELTERMEAEEQGPGVLVSSGVCLLYTSPSPRDLSTSRMPSSA